MSFSTYKHSKGTVKMIIAANNPIFTIFKMFSFSAFNRFLTNIVPANTYQVNHSIIIQ